jgi:hypothetical protein
LNQFAVSGVAGLVAAGLGIFADLLKKQVIVQIEPLPFSGLQLGALPIGEEIRGNQKSTKRLNLIWVTRLTRLLAKSGN